MELFPNMAVMLKIDEQSRSIITSRALDSGFQSCLFADLRTADDVKECIRLVRAESPEIAAYTAPADGAISGGYGGARWRFRHCRLGQRNERCRYRGHD